MSESELAAFGEWIRASTGDRLVFASGEQEKGVRHGPNEVTHVELTRWAKNWLDSTEQPGGEAKAVAVAAAAWQKVLAEGDFPKPS